MTSGIQLAWTDALLSGILWIIIIPLISRIICEVLLILTDIKTNIISQYGDQNQIEKEM